ncbi:MAG: hypothetical protein GKR90_27225 [Pseudomonadales bacterium]|nr:hypothetical protein [Pseudomonadales bacterium]
MLVFLVFGKLLGRNPFSTGNVYETSRSRPWAEVVTNVAVLVGLIFVAYEVHQNTVNQGMTAYQDLVGRITELNRMSIENSELSRVRAEIIDQRFNELSEHDKRMWTAYSWMLFRHGDMAYFQFELGALDETRMRSAMGILIDMLRVSSATRDHWKRASRNFVPGYREYIDGIIEEF